MIKRIIFKTFLVFFLGCSCSYALQHPTSFATNDIKNFNHYPANVKKLIIESLKLNQMHLKYIFGSSNPKNGGMDCSGVIQYVLKKFLTNVPRQADEFYKWAWTKGHFVAVTSKSLSSFEFSKLKPGDILFWSGTYPVHRTIPVTHMMMYLGKNKNNQPILFGSSVGRSYQAKQVKGVSVFAFRLPGPHSKSRFLGYSCIPNLTC